MTSLDMDLVHFTHTSPRKGDGLSEDECFAINVFWREGLKKVRVLAAVFGVSPNTIYYRCLTGKAKSYPRKAAQSAIRINRRIDEIGLEEARRRYVKNWMVDGVNDELTRRAEAIVERQARRRQARRRAA